MLQLQRVKKKMKEIHKKIKHLTHTMIVWAENHKIKNAGDYDYSIPSRNGVEWKDDLKWVTKLDRILSDDGLPENQQKLTTNEKKMCNMLYRFYRD